jgi:transposase-like protein
MQKLGIITCPSCGSDSFEKYSDSPGKENKCKDCGKVFGDKPSDTPNVGEAE